MTPTASCRDCGCDLPPTALACPVCRTVRKRTWVLYIVILVGLICAGTVLISELGKERKQSYAMHTHDAVRDREQQDLDAAANAIVAKLKAEREAARTGGTATPAPAP